MHPPSSSESSWCQFDRFVRAGVPHAMDIAQDLSRSSLSIPGAPTFDLQAADLLFYGPVHSAHRRGILARFLKVMEELSGHDSWAILRNCRSAQLTLIETFETDSQSNDSECVALLCLWMSAKGALQIVPELSPLFKSNDATARSLSVREDRCTRNATSSQLCFAIKNRFRG